MIFVTKNTYCEGPKGSNAETGYLSVMECENSQAQISQCSYRLINREFSFDQNSILKDYSVTIILWRFSLLLNETMFWPFITPSPENSSNKVSHLIFFFFLWKTWKIIPVIPNLLEALCQSITQEVHKGRLIRLWESWLCMCWSGLCYLHKPKSIIYLYISKFNYTELWNIGLFM